ncbi:hypothetical protein [Maribacter aestuarii]|uniref:hypothetical protein n=1 Tax=Maribacter aestuarii TaxID=1130723 RepID=UPI00248C46D4|nr:hypothetical protein [Maribacter aestuarii]
MKTYLKLRYVFLAMLICTILNSCSKDTDLVSEYLIRDADKNEVSFVSERTVNYNFSVPENKRFANLTQSAKGIENL